MIAAAEHAAGEQLSAQETALSPAEELTIGGTEV